MYIYTLPLLLVGLVLIFIFSAYLNEHRRAHEYETTSDLLGQILGQLHNTILATNADGIVVYVHKDLHMIHDQDTRDLIGKEVASLYPHDHEEATGIWNGVFHDRQPYAFRLTLSWVSDHEQQSTVIGRPVIIKHRLAGMVVELPDEPETTTKPQTRLSVEPATAKEKVIVENIGDGVIVTNAEGTVVLVNRAARELLSVNTPYIGQAIEDIFPLEDKNNTLLLPGNHPVYEALENRQNISSRSYSYIRNNINKVILAMTVNPVVVEGTVIGSVAVFRDVTREQDVDRAKTEFVSLASHQLRTPLTTISWYTELLSGSGADNLTAQQKEYLGVIYQGTQRMIELVNALLNVSRLELGTFIIEPEPTKLKDLIQSVMQDLVPITNQKNHVVAFEYDSGLEEVNIDPKLTRMIIQNLLTNAVKYTPDHGRIKIVVSRHYPDILISVTDNGYGIPINEQNKVFTKLFRADNVVVRNTEGTGLGLYIVKSILDHAGGKIWFESAEDHGTTFYVTLPLEGMKKRGGTKTLA